MPTPLRYFVKVAQKWGNIDPTDHQAIEEWFLNDFQKLPEKDLNAILDELIENSNKGSVDPGKIVYPSDIPLPLFNDIVPVSEISWTRSYKEFIYYIRNLITTNRNRSS